MSIYGNKKWKKEVKRRENFTKETFIMSLKKEYPLNVVNMVFDYLYKMVRFVPIGNDDLQKDLFLDAEEFDFFIEDKIISFGVRTKKEYETLKCFSVSPLKIAEDYVNFLDLAIKETNSIRERQDLKTCVEK
ncbi:MAG: hypothetical protein LBV54_00480 [Puniceicoccales bacterium]|jgi:hypothetical protein|nr:hypothetical protein [Puniceicoccales bacterium]